MENMEMGVSHQLVLKSFLNIDKAKYFELIYFNDHFNSALKAVDTLRMGPGDKHRYIYIVGVIFSIYCYTE